MQEAYSAITKPTVISTSSLAQDAAEENTLIFELCSYLHFSDGPGPIHDSWTGAYCSSIVRMHNKKAMHKDLSVEGL